MQVFGARFGDLRIASDHPHGFSRWCVEEGHHMLLALGIQVPSQKVIGGAVM